jgi:hypothetical protein
MLKSITSAAAPECLRRAAEARKWAAASHNSAEKADLLDVAAGWLRLARSGAPKPEFEDLKEASGW